MQSLGLAAGSTLSQSGLVQRSKKEVAAPIAGAERLNYKLAPA
jgi:hypothetical protein